jgi:SAM-dependent methyltransferase
MGERIMAMAASFDPHRFRSTAEHYRAGRPDYSPRLIRRVAALGGLTPAGRVLDLGCGPGLLAFAFAPLAAEVTAIDPEPEMLAAVAEGPGNVRPVQGSSFDLSPRLGRFRLVVMGRSFHWMERAETLRRLDEMVEPGGPVALFSTRQPDLPENAWVDEFKALRRRFEPDDPAHPRRRSGWVPHEAVLLDSPFNRLETASVIERREIAAETLVHRALSQSGTAPLRLGEARAREYTAAIEALAARQARRGMIAEVVESHALLGFRPGEEPT